MNSEEVKDRNQAITVAPEDYIKQLPENVIRLLSAWMTLSEEEKDTLSEAIRKINGLPDEVRDPLPNIVVDIPLRPLRKRRCPYCGHVWPD
jgi:hypothetical protein